MPMSFAQTLGEYLAGQEHEGCTEEEIAQLQSLSPLPLPEDYVTFLRLMGRGAERFMVGTDWEFYRVMEMQEGAQELLAAEGVDKGFPPYFAFAMHQGYQFFCFREDGVYYFYEGAPEKRGVKYATFAEWFAVLRGW